MVMLEIAASILSADFSQLGSQLREAFAAGASRVHVDVMDGQFVDNLGMGPHVVKAVRPIADEFGAQVSVHLMIVAPGRFLARFAEAGAHSVLVHVEDAPHIAHDLQRIRELGASPGVVINPSTPLVMLEEVLVLCDGVLLMGVDPGFGGQSFIPTTLDKIARLRRMLDARNLGAVRIAVDGGVHVDSVAGIARAGADIVVAGSALFDSRAPVADNLRALRAAANRA